MAEGGGMSFLSQVFLCVAIDFVVLGGFGLHSLVGGEHAAHGVAQAFVPDTTQAVAQAVTPTFTPTFTPEFTSKGLAFC